MPGPSSLEAPAIKQSVPIARLERRADINVRPDPAHQTTQETSSWSQPLNDDKADTHSSGVNVAGLRRDVVLTRQQQTPTPQEQETRPSSVPETTFSKDPVGFQPTPPNSASPIEFSVYKPDVDPGYDELFDLVQDVRDNKTQGDAAEDAELKRIKEGKSSGSIRAKDKDLRRRHFRLHGVRHNVPPQRNVLHRYHGGQIWRRQTHAESSGEFGRSDAHGKDLHHKRKGG